MACLARIALARASIFVASVVRPVSRSRAAWFWGPLGQLGMLWPQGLLPDRQRPLVERLGFGVAALGVVQRGEIVEAGGDVRMIGPERLLPDRQGSPLERLGLGVAALGLVQIGEVVEALRDIGMVRPERLLIDRQGALH